MKKIEKTTKIYISVICVSLAVFILAAALTSAFSSDGEASLEDDVQSVAVSLAEGFNVLILGTDRASGLTDVIMLVSINGERKEATIMQLPRDTYASYTDKSYKKLNGAYGALGGGAKLCGFLSGALGVPIDKYLVLSPDALCGVVDAVGGVEIELSEPLYYNDPYQNLKISLPAGRQTLNGTAAEQFIRYRSGYANGDLGRIDAQKVFLTSLLKGIASDTSPARIFKIASALLGKTDTNVTAGDLYKITEAFIGVTEDNVRFVTAPGEAVLAEQSGASYYVLSAPAMNELLCGYFGADGRSFDKKGVFLNSRYESFKAAYRGHSRYKVYTARKIAEDGLGNASVGY